MAQHHHRGAQPGMAAPHAAESALPHGLASLGSDPGLAADVVPTSANAREVGFSGAAGKNGNGQRDSEATESPFQVADGVTSVAKRLALEAVLASSPGCSASAQQVRMLAALRLFPVDTFEASRVLDVYDPPARIMALRKRGHQILMVWKRVHTECGLIHRVGNYVLAKEAHHAAR